MLFLVLIFFFFYLLMFPQTALASTRDGLLLWYSGVLPVLFPFMLLCSLLLKFHFLERLPKILTKPFQAIFGVSAQGAFAMLAGFFCGFPMGAKITSDLQREGKLDENEARFLFGFVNNLSPAFLLSFVAVQQLECPKLGPVLLLNISGSAMLYGFLTSICYRRKKSGSSSAGTHTLLHRQSTASVYDVIDSCIYDTVRNTVKLGAYIIIFKIISDAFFRFVPLNHPLLLFLGASIEVTGGIHLLAASQLAFPLKFVLINALCAFGGFSALAQTVSIAALDGNMLFYYIKSRVMITLLSTALSVGSILFL